VPPPDTGGVSPVAWPLTAARVAAWVAMLAAALREVPRRSDVASADAAT